MSPALLAMLLAVLFAQVVTGAKPPALVLQPHVFLVALVSHGWVAVWARETAWRARGADGRVWPRLTRLAAGCGLLLYAVVLRDAQSGDWSRLGPLADTQHGHWAGFNWTWTLLAVDSYVALAVLLPVTAVDLLRPAARAQAWLSDRRCRWLSVGLALAFVLGAPQGCPASPATVLPALLVGGWLVGGARRWQPRVWRALGPVAPRRLALALAAATVALLCLAGFRVPRPDPFPFPRIGFAFTCAAGLTGLLVWRLTKRVLGGWDDHHRLAALVGGLGPWLVLALGQARDQYHLDNPTGLGVVALGTAWWLWRLRRGIGVPPMV